MIAEQVQLSESLSKKLRDWLDKPEINILITVADGHAKTAQVEALKLVQVATAGAPLKFTEANGSLETAHRYFTFIQVLQEIASQDEFHDVKIS